MLNEGDTGLAAAHDALLADPQMQFELLPPDPPPAPPGWLRWLAEILQALGPYWEWIAGALVIGLLLYFFAPQLRTLYHEWRSGGEPVVRPDWRPDASDARSLLAEADAMAGSGDFERASRLLLYRSIEDIDRAMPGIVRPAFTSREIAALDVLPEAARGVFAGIAAAVERAVFARRRLSAEDWQSIRNAYDEFAFG